jgi:hypothetical protein
MKDFSQQVGIEIYLDHAHLLWFCLHFLPCLFCMVRLKMRKISDD